MNSTTLALFFSHMEIFAFVHSQLVACDE